MNAHKRQNKQILLSTQALPSQPKSVAFSALMTGMPSPDIRKRKGSTDSHKSSSNRNPSATTSQGRSNTDKNNKQTKSQQQNQQSASRSNNKGGNNMRPGMNNTKPAQSAIQGRGGGMRRPNSAAVLNKDPSQTNFKTLSTMLTSPTVALLSREPSQSFLPPKPYGPVRNSTFAKLPNALYQSVGSHPLAHAASSGYISSSAFNSQQKRMPSASTERSKQRANIQSNRPNAVFEMNPDQYQGNHDVNTFSPLRRKQVDNYMTNPSSNQKSNGKAKSKTRQNHQQQQHSSVKRKRSSHHVKVLESAQTMSPNIERIRPDRIIKEENKEEEDTQRDNKDKNNLYLDESEIVQMQEKDKNKENEGVDSQNSSLSFKLQTKKLFRAKTIKEAEIDLIKDFKQQLQTLNNQGEDKQKVKLIDKKDKLLKDNELNRKQQIDLMKQQMSKKLEGTNKITLGRKKQINQQLLEQKEQEDLIKKKMEKKEQYQKEKEERQEIFEIYKEVKIPIMSSQSNSQTRKRELSKSQQRPMSAKVINHDFQAQQLTIKVPPVQTENVINNLHNAYDAVLTQSDNMSEIHALSEQMVDLNKMVSFQDVEKKRDENGQIVNYINKQKRERSKKRKTVENMEQYKEFKKQKALRMLQDQYKQNYEQFKVKQMQQIQQYKGKIKRKPKAKQSANQDEYYASSQLITLGKKGRSKSKKRILDEEKENWQGSVSPGRGRSGTRSRSDKKNGRHKHVMQSQEMLSTVSMGSIQRLSKNVYELLGQKDLAQTRYQKSQTLANLHSQMGRENINQQKQNLKSLQGFTSLSASKDDLSSNQEQSFNQQNQYDPSQFRSQDFGVVTQEYNQLTDEQKNAFINEQKQQESTPVIMARRKQNHPLTQTSNSQVVILGRPSDSVKSFDVIQSQGTTPIQQKQIINNWMKQTQNKLEIIQKQQDQDQQVEDQQARLQQKPRSPPNEDMRSSKNIKVRSSKKELQDGLEFENQRSSPIASPSKGNHQMLQRSNEKSKHQQKSSSKKKKKIKRNQGQIISSLQAPQQVQSSQVTFAGGEKKKLKESQANAVLLQRPKSANIQKINMIELIQQQKKQQQEKKQQQKKNKAVLLIQRFARGYLDRKQIKLKREQIVYEQNFQMIKDKYFKTLKEQKDEQIVNIVASPIKSIISEPKVQEVQIQQKPTIPQQQILNQSDNSQNKSNINQSQLSRSQASLKALIAQEEDKLKKRRPNSSDIMNKKKVQQTQKTKQVFQYEPEQDKELKNIQKVVTDRIEFQTRLNQQAEQQNKILKGQFSQDSLSSLHHSNHIEESKSNNESKKINQNQQNNLLIKAQQNVRKVEGGAVPIQKIGMADLESFNSANKDSSVDFKDELYSSDKYSFEKNKKSQIEEKKDKVLIKKQDILSKQQNNLPGLKTRIQDDKMQNLKKSQEVQNKFFQKVNNGNIHLGLAHSQLLSNSQQLNVNTITSEDKDQSWQFDRRSFQDFFDQNSQGVQEINQVPKIESLQGSGTKQKMNLSRKLSQYEEMLEVLQKNHDKEKTQLKKLQQKSHLSPKSLKKKMQLERWVTKQEEQLNSQKKLFQQNVNEMITKIDKDLQQTKKRIGQKKISNNVFNNSVEWSHDMSLGQVNSSSIHSTPRIPKPQSIKAFTEMSQTERNLKRPFEYKIPSKEEEKSGIEFKNQQSINSAKSSEPIVVEEEDQISNISEKKNALSSLQDEKDKLMFISSMKDSMKDMKQTNIFDYNLAASVRDDNDLSDTDIKNDDKGDKSTRKNDHQSSLSMSEPPQFQSPTLSVISPNQNQQDFYNDEEGKQNQMFMDTFERTTEGKYGNKELIISTLSPEMMRQHDTSIKEEAEPIKPEPFSNKFLSMENEELADAFLALKEPEQPFSFKEAQSMREEKELREMQADDLTNYIMLLLLEQAKHNMYPKRPFISGMKSPGKEEEPQEIEREPISLNLSAGEISTGFNKSDDNIKRGSDVSLQSEKNSLKEKIMALKEEKRKKKLRGIKTTMRIVDTYLTEVFKKVKDSEDEFVENLSTPLNKDPLEILLHLQNVCLEQEFDNAVAFQQSVLPVDLYLDIERNKEKVQIIENPLSDGVEFEENDNKSMMAEWENIHNKVIFDAINEALDNFRPYGLRGPPMPWSQQTRTLTYKNGQQIDQVLKNVRLKVIEWARTFSGALPCSELLQEYGIRGPLDEDKLNLLREERLALVLASEIEENEILWTDYEYEETQAKLDIADMILEVLAEEAVQEISKIKESRQLLNTTESTTVVNE